MANKDYKAFIVEGEAREPLIIDNISKVFFKHVNFKIITLPAGQNIYMLWKKLKEDDFDTDIIEVLREEHEELKEQLEGISRDDFSEVYLFFDYDGHQNNLSGEDDSDALEQMLVSFDNETENGKLYISYPMVEALRDFEFLSRAEKLKELEMIRRFEVVRNAERTPASNYDVALIFDFDTIEALNEYQTSKLHLEFGEFVGSVRVERACIDFEV